MRRLVGFALTVAACVLAGPIVAEAQAAPVGTITNYTDPSFNAPQSIAAGPDGALWFVNIGGNKGPGARLARITTTGSVTNYTSAEHQHPPDRDRGRARRRAVVHQHF